MWQRLMVRSLLSQQLGDWCQFWWAKEPVRFLVVGTFSSLVSYVFFVALVLRFDYVTSLYVSFALGVIASFGLHKRVTFGHRAAGRWKRQLGWFIVKNVVLLAMNHELLFYFIELEKMQAWLAQGLATAILALFSYVLMKLIFKI